MSCLKVNRGETYLSIFGENLGAPECVERQGIKLCTSFTLLGITFDQTLNMMDRNYDECSKKVRDKLNSWRFRYLTVFGKITVIKNMCLPKFTHIGTVIPSLFTTRTN